MSSSIGPKTRLSSLFSRLSPITNTSPSGTVTASGMFVRVAGLEVGLVDQLAVDVQAAVAGLEMVAPDAHHPLDQVLDLVVAAVGRSGRALEDDDVAAVDVVELVGQLVDQDAVPHLQRRDHGRRRDPERLDQERLDDEGDDDAPTDDRHPLEDRAAHAAGRLVLGRSGAAVTPVRLVLAVRRRVRVGRAARPARAVGPFERSSGRVPPFDARWRGPGPRRSPGRAVPVPGASPWSSPERPEGGDSSRTAQWRLAQALPEGGHRTP